jgi:hypothetical protein
METLVLERVDGGSHAAVVKREGHGADKGRRSEAAGLALGCRCGI